MESNKGKAFKCSDTGEIKCSDTGEILGRSENINIGVTECRGAGENLEPKTPFRQAQDRGYIELQKPNGVIASRYQATQSHV